MSGVKVKAKTAMDCMGVSRSVGQEFEMSESDAIAHSIAGLVEVLDDKVKAKMAKETAKQAEGEKSAE